MGQDDMRVSAQISAAEFGLIDHADRHVHVMIEEVPDFPGIAGRVETIVAAGNGARSDQYTLKT